MKGKRLIIAIDGPAAAGKSTAGKRLASRLGYLYIDTGALYRAVAWLATEEGFSAGNPAALAERVRNSRILLRNEAAGQRVLVDDRDVTDEIRSEAMGHLASSLSALKEVREALLDTQRRLGAAGGVVMDGRDIGTVIFPEADVKFFLSAGPEERGKRRWRELRERGTPAAQDEVRADLARRDRRDRSRSHAPLRAAPDAVRIDSTGLTPEEVEARMLSVIEAVRTRSP